MATALEYGLVFSVIVVAAVGTAHCTRKPEPTITAYAPKPKPTPILVPLKPNVYGNKFSVLVDRETGCHYLRDDGYALLPRYAPDGKTIMGCKSKDSSSSSPDSKKEVK